MQHFSPAQINPNILSIPNPPAPTFYYIDSNGSFYINETGQYYIKPQE